MHATANTITTTVTTTTVATITTTPATTFITTTCKAQSIKMKISRVYQYTDYQKSISAMSYQRLTSLSSNFQDLMRGQYINTTALLLLI